MLFNLPINLSIDEEDLEKKITNELYDDIKKDVEKKVELAFLRRDYSGCYYYDREDDKQAINSWIHTKVDEIIESHREEILKAVENKLVDKIFKSKVFKESVTTTLKNHEQKG